MNAHSLDTRFSEAPAPLAGYVEGGGIRDGHHCHDAALDGVCDHEVRHLGDAAGHVEGEDDDALLSDLAHGPCDFTAHQGPGEHQGDCPRQSRHGPCGGGYVLLTDERDGVHRDLLATDVVPVGLGHGAHHDLAHLGAAAHHDYPLAVDLAERRRPLDGGDAGNPTKVPHEELETLLEGAPVGVLQFEVDGGGAAG